MPELENTDKNNNNDIENLVDANKDNTMDLVNLIRDGVNAKRAITVTLPDGREGNAMIRPLSMSEWDSCTSKFMKLRGSMELYVCEKGLLTTDEEPFPSDLIKLLPAGTVQEIYTEIREISGIKSNKEEEKELTRELLNL